MLSNFVFPVGRDNYGGVDRFWFIPESDIDYVDELKQVVLKAGKQWYLGKATRYSVTFTNPSADARSGTSYLPTIKGLTSKHTPEMENLLTYMRGKRFVVVYKDKNGYLNQVGTKGQPLKFTTEHTTGDDPGTKNGVIFTFEGKTKQPPVHYIREIVISQEVPVDLPTSEPSTVYVNNVLVRSLHPGERFDIKTQFSLQFDII